MNRSGGTSYLRDKSRLVVNPLDLYEVKRAKLFGRSIKTIYSFDKAGRLPDGVSGDNDASSRADDMVVRWK